MDDRRQELLRKADPRIIQFTYGSVNDWLVEQAEMSVAQLEDVMERPAFASIAGKLRKQADEARAFLKEHKAKQAYLAEHPDIASQRIE
jgi:hypothetical protein